VHFESKKKRNINCKTATFGTFLNILFHKSTLKLRALSKAFFCVISSSYLAKKLPIVAVLLFKCSDLEGDFPIINEMHIEAMEMDMDMNYALLSNFHELIS